VPSLIRTLYRVSPALGTAARVAQIVLRERGLLRSLWEGAPVDGDGAPVPWITLPARDFLSQFDFASAHVLEFGGGQSTLWWASRARAVTTVESNGEWVARLRPRLPANATLLGPLSGSEYVDAGFSGGHLYDVIVIDGIEREACVEATLEHAAPGAMIVLDNSDWYPHLCSRLRDAGYLDIALHGLGPMNGYTWCTSVFVRADLRVPQRGQRWDPRQHGNHVNP
jgi:hypothetical protein